jgi:manganese/iron transport system ATP-binding protein
VDWNFPVSVADVVMMGRSAKLGPLNWPHKRDWEYVHHALETVELSDLATRQIGQLSGGQQQRMFIARALAQEAELMLMDEPLSGLDTPSQEGLLNLLDTLRDQQVTVMVATHDLDQAARHFDRIMLLNHSMIAFGEPQNVLHTDNLLQAYGGRLKLDTQGEVGKLPRLLASDVIGKQLIRAGTSIGANYRAACRAKSTADMMNKMGSTVFNGKPF